MVEREYVSDVIGQGFIEWGHKDTIFIESGTGSGKTTFVLNELWHHARSLGRQILFVCNRKILLDQVRFKIAKENGIPTDDLEWLQKVSVFNCIEVITYQGLQEKFKNQRNFDEYRNCYYIVFDEIHYVLNDALFNADIGYLLEFLPIHCGCKIFMSATMPEVKAFLKDWLWKEKLIKIVAAPSETIKISEISDSIVYTQMRNQLIWEYRIAPQEFPMEIYVFENYDQIVNCINADNSNLKWLLFVSNINKSKGGFYKNIKGKKAFISSGEKEANLIDEITRDEMFSVKTLVTTKLLDNGINICDPLLKNIVIDTPIQEEFVQMLGRRRRVGDDDSIRVFIPKKSVKYFCGYWQLALKSTLEFIDQLHTEFELKNILLKNMEHVDEVRRFYYFDLSNSRFKLNPAAVYKMRRIANFIQHMANEMDSNEWAFVEEQLRWLGGKNQISTDNDLGRREQNKVLQELRIYLEEKCGQDLDKSAQKDFRQNICSFANNAGKILGGAKTRLASLNAIKTWFAEMDVPYTIENCGGKRKGETTIWNVKGRDDNDGLDCTN